MKVKSAQPIIDNHTKILHQMKWNKLIRKIPNAKPIYERKKDDRANNDE